MDKIMLAYVYKGNGELGLVQKPVPKAEDDTAVVKILASFHMR